MVKKGILALLVLFLIPIVWGIQVNSSTEIYSFEVLNCQANDSDIGCPAVDVRFSCNITPYTFIDYTLFRIDGTDHTTSRSSEIFYYDWHKATTPNDIDTYIQFERGQIHDISGGDSLFFPNVSVHLNCDACNYNVSTDPCQVDDTQMVHYVGDGSPNCTSYNASESCDYCSVEWSKTSSCLENNTEYRQYEDSNSCYGLTGLYTDSCDYSFIDCDTWKPCNYLGEDMPCEYDTNPLIDILGNRIYWKCTISNSTSNYDCISYIKQNGSIIQTSPQQKTYSSGIFSREQETREFFTATNGLVNPYFTTENLNTNTTYVFGVECTNNGSNLKTEQYITPMYSNLDVVAYRSVWFKNNIGYLMGGFIFLVLIGIVIAMWVRSR